MLGSYIWTIKQRAVGRFDVYSAQHVVGTTTTQTQNSTDAQKLGLLLGLAGQTGHSRAVVQLRRQKANGAGLRTLLLTELPTIDKLSPALTWAANVRDQLSRIEKSDLYLIVLVPEVDTNQRLRVESDENFCRKFVAATTDPIEGLLDRTFLYLPSAMKSADTPMAPLAVALESTAARVSWMDEETIESWKQALTSGEGSPEISRRLFEAVKSGRS